MTALSSVQQIVTVIRAAMVGRAAAPGGTARPPKRRAAGRPDSGPGLGALIAARVAAIDPDDPARGRRAFRIFLEAVLLNELGQQLINDPAFYALADAVERQIAAEPALALLAEAASAALLSDESAMTTRPHQAS
ncbi:hypothetical protein [Massilia endophytica]|uniref:hypothetical protein n=1 Tax=Massilia endophytica TaxID=2899220 RepID=UPI001E481D48|nr:hypothetical protein [Massilia endophytica]UGQ47981.1 hypothetical protein LSQ66_05815 [Massilia endophytica]